MQLDYNTSAIDEMALVVPANAGTTMEGVTI
jgi:hypothetical protein